MQGKMAISRAGHDKDSIYVIIKEEAAHVYLADGKSRAVEKPKMKNKKHIQIVKELPKEITEMLSPDIEFRNEKIKRAIKLYQKSECD